MNSEETTNRIKILDQHTANQIAAGEVVERPFSVIKELVENAIDAEATAISVRIFDANLEKMQISDNGYGMSPDEMRLAVLRHATSKITQAADLHQLHSLGFRGEALPSIASVSQMSIISQQKNAENGYCLNIIDGKPSIPEIAAAQAGTTVIVDRLFYNAPARKKFLKTPRTEIGLISDLLARYIVAYPQIAFRLVNGSHTIFNSSGKGNARHALFEAYGKNVAEQMIAFSQGFVSPPALNRANRNNYNFFINGRFVRSRELGHAVDEAYFNFMPKHRYAIVFIFLQLDPGAIDVNVHPGKLEVKFDNFAAIRAELIEQIRAALGKSGASAPEIITKEAKVAMSTPEQGEPGELVDQRDNFAAPAGSYSAGLATETAMPLRESGALNRGIDIYQALQSYNLDQTQQELPTDRFIPEYQSTQEQLFADDGQGNQQLVYSQLTPLGQFAGTFIVAVKGEYLYIIDQHAAAERILYEKIAAASIEHLGDSSGLAVPISLDLSYQEAMQLTDLILGLREQGFIIEHFGENTFVIRGVPIWYDGDDPEQLLRLFLSELAEAPANIARMRKDELFMAACKQAIKANRFLTITDISVLFADLDHCENSSTCPHGRPLAIKLSRAEIYKRFLRGSI